MKINKQKGYYGIGNAMTTFIIVSMIISAVVGWGVIEGIIWIFSHLTIGWA